MTLLRFGVINRGCCATYFLCERFTAASFTTMSYICRRPFSRLLYSTNRNCDSHFLPMSHAREINIINPTYEGTFVARRIAQISQRRSPFGAPCRSLIATAVYVLARVRRRWASRNKRRTTRLFKYIQLISIGRQQWLPRHVIVPADMVANRCMPAFAFRGILATMGSLK